MPSAGERDDALRQEVQEFLVAAERSGPSVAVPVGLADDLMDAVAVCPLRCDALDAGAAAMHEDQVAVLGASHLQPRDDRKRCGVPTFLSIR